eukprot:6022536-Ditylum_brightwellii.AAC.1
MIANGQMFIPEFDSVETDEIELLFPLEMKHACALTNMIHSHISKGGLFEAVGGASAFLGEQTSSSYKQTQTNTDSQIAFLKEKDGKDQNLLLFVWNEDESKDAESGRMLQLPLTVVLTPSMEVMGDYSIPITSHYHYIADPLAISYSNPPKASFHNLPSNHILTLRMDVPEPWDVQQKYHVQNTDNLHCDAQSGYSNDAYKASLQE